MSQLSPIQEFYKDKTIFLTGATGFVGNAVIDKLLRSCPGIKRIYVLIRPKNGVTTVQRISDIFNSVYFDLMKTENPNFKEFITIVNGDLFEDKLGLSEEDTTTLTNEVNIVIHVAATIKFDEKIRIATKLNIVAVKNLLDLTKKFPNLKSFVQVSTAYSQCNRPENKEEFFEPLRDSLEFIQYIEKTSDEELEKETPNIICGYPNTYTYTKGLAEDIIRKEGTDLPLCIVRPSVVMGAWAEPIPGWVDNLAGPLGLMAGVGYGFVRAMYADTSKRVDVIPVDMTANAILAAGYSITLRNKNDPIQIYNMVTGSSNPIIWEELMNWCLNFIHPYFPAGSLWTPKVLVTNCVYAYETYKFLFHTIPSHILDFVLKIRGKKQIFVKIYDKIDKGQKMFTFFLTNEWRFHDDNTRNLYSSLDTRDQQIFNFDVTKIKWDLYFCYNCRMLRTNLMKDPLSTIPIALKKKRRYEIINHIIIILCVFFIYYLFTALL